MEVSQEFLDTVRRVSEHLQYRVPATPVEGEMLHIPVEGMGYKPEIWSGQVTTYTLGLMLGGALLLETEHTSSERR